jgi:DNA polymerase (family 10)
MDVPPQNTAIAALLNRIGRLYGIRVQVLHERNATKEAIKKAQSKQRAFIAASQTIAMHSDKLTLQLKPGQIPNVGRSNVAEIKEYLKTGKLSRLKRLEKKYGSWEEKAKELQQVHGIGPRKAHKLLRQGITKVEDIPDDQLTSAMKTSIKYVKGSGERVPRRAIEKIEAQITLPGNWDIVGSYRRGEDTSGDIDILVADMKMEDVLLNLDWLIGDILESGPKVTRCYTKEGYRLDIKIVPGESYPYALLHATGSDSFNKKLRIVANKFGLTLNEYGLYDIEDVDRIHSVRVPEERYIFAALGVKYIPPNLRTGDVVFHHTA